MTPRVRSKLRRNLTKKSDAALSRWIADAAHRAVFAAKMGAEELTVYWEEQYELACIEQARRMSENEST